MKPVLELKPLVYTDYQAYCDANDRIAYHELSSPWQWHYVYLQTLVETGQTLTQLEAQEIVNKLIVKAASTKTTMTWPQYCKLALKTESIPVLRFNSIQARNRGNTIQAENALANEETRATRLMHAAAGLVTETDELRTGTGAINWIEELGDCFWYLPIIEHCLDTTFEPNLGAFAGNPTSSELMDQMATQAANLIDQCLKRHVIYGKPLDVEIVKRNTQHYVDALYSLSSKIATSPSEVWEANIAKLKKRYPDGRFDVVATSNRDVENELSHIKGDKTVVDFQEPMSGSEKYLAAQRVQTLDPNNLLSMEEMQARLADPVGEVIAEDTRMEQAPDVAKQLWFNTEKYHGLQIEKDVFTELLLKLPVNKVQPMVAEWARTLANDAVLHGAHCLNEGYKTAYNKLMAGKVDKDFYLEAWFIFNLIPGTPVAVEEVKEWLLNQL